MSGLAPDMASLQARTDALLASDRLTAPTRRALRARLDLQAGEPRALTDAQLRTLQAVCLRLIPEPELVARVALAQRFDAKLADAVPRGWRLAQAPDDLALVRSGLDALDRIAQSRGGPDFAALEAGVQDALLQDASEGRPDTADAPLDLWFAETLSQLVELYYAHPLVQVAIGYDGMADAYGVHAVSPKAIAKERS